MVAVLRELKNAQPDVEVRFWCDRKFAPQARAIVAAFDPKIPITTIHAGKLRRYHTLSLWRQFLRPTSILLPNLRDFFFVIVGYFESIVRLILWRPDAVFTKGGYVCLPVGMAACLLRIPLVIHDSDAHPGLTNRLLARGAAAIATGAPLHHYSYPDSKSRYVGIPISSAFRPFTADEKAALKEKMEFETDVPLVVVTGGGLGAQRLNLIIADALHDLIVHTSVLLISGTGHYEELKKQLPLDNPRFQLLPFVNEGMHEVLGAADIVVARAGATTIMELAALAKPTILVPNPFLTGGHQLKNAQAFSEGGAVVVLSEDALFKDSSQLVSAVKELLNDENKLEAMQRKFHSFSKPDAAREVAGMIIAAAHKA